MARKTTGLTKNEAAGWCVVCAEWVAIGDLRYVRGEGIDFDLVYGFIVGKHLTCGAVVRDHGAGR